MTKIFVGNIAWRALEAEHVWCILQLATHPNVMFFPRVGDALVDRARSMVATKFLLESDADVLVTIDSDIIFKADDVLRIAEQAVTHDMVAGLYVTRGAGEFCIPTSILEKDEPVVCSNDPDPPLVPIRWAASGFLATHRRVLEALAKDLPLCHPTEKWRFYPFYLPFVAEDDGGRPIELAEDYAFCERGRQAGFGVWANPSVRLSHIGVYHYRLEDMYTHRPPTQDLTVTRVSDVQPNIRYRLEYPDGQEHIGAPSSDMVQQEHKAAV